MAELAAKPGTAKSANTSAAALRFNPTLIAPNSMTRATARNNTWPQTPAPDMENLPLIHELSANTKAIGWVEQSLTEPQCVGRHKKLPLSGRPSIMKNLLMRFLAAESGATAVEYGLIISGIAIALIAAANGVGNAIIGTFEQIAAALQ